MKNDAQGEVSVGCHAAALAAPPARSNNYAPLKLISNQLAGAEQSWRGLTNLFLQHPSTRLPRRRHTRALSTVGFPAPLYTRIGSPERPHPTTSPAHAAACESEKGRPPIMSNKMSRPKPPPPGNEEASANLNLGEFQNVDTLTLSEASLVLNALVAKRRNDRKNVNETEYAPPKTGTGAPDERG